MFLKCTQSSQSLLYHARLSANLKNHFLLGFCRLLSNGVAVAQRVDVVHHLQDVLEQFQVNILGVIGTSHVFLQADETAGQVQKGHFFASHHFTAAILLRGQHPWSNR